MNKYHQEILTLIKSAAKKDYKYKSATGYHGTTHKFYSLSNPEKDLLIKSWVKEHKDLSFNDFIALLNSLFSSDSYEEKTIASSLISYYPKHKQNLDPNMLDKWLEQLEGWAEIDNLCQSTFNSNDLLSNWSVWESLLTDFAKSENISKRRASLVLLTKAVREINDVRLRNKCFENIEKLKNEKDILITKAVSWLLRSMVKNYKTDVATYVANNISTLPKIAVRETLVKLKTGRKVAPKS